MIASDIFTFIILLSLSFVMIVRSNWVNYLFAFQYKLMRNAGLISKSKRQFQASTTLIKVFGVVWFFISMLVLVVIIRGEPI